MFRTDRLPYWGATLLGLVFLSQAFRLENWTFLGPGPGVFPQIATSFTTILALVLLAVPALSPPAPAEDEPPPAPEELRNFRLYLAGLVLLVVGTAWLGFLLTCVLVALLLTALAERRSWGSALVFGLACGLIGTVGLGYLLQVEMPASEIDLALLRLIR